jgi:hypothetical protein
VERRQRQRRWERGGKETETVIVRRQSGDAIEVSENIYDKRRQE